MSEPSGTKPYKGAAGGWGALASVSRHLLHQDIPLLGALFRQSSKGDTKRELLIFITPKIVQQGLAMTP